MTPPFSIGSEVIITGPSLTKDTCHTGEKITIDQIYLSGRSGESLYSKRGYPGYPASSLQLVEEPKIGDWVEVVGASITGNADDIGKRFKIEEIDDPSWPYHQKGYSHHGLMWSIWPASSLRKLTPEEIAMHTGYKMQDFQAVTSKGMAALGKLLAPIVETHVADAIKRLSDIESRMNSIGPSHSELMGDVEALAEKVGAIEKQLADLKETYNEDGRFQAKINCDIKERLCILEGEMPEVCEGKPNVGFIRMMISRDGQPYQDRIFIAESPEECLKWAKRVLDSMREVRRT